MANPPSPLNWLRGLCMTPYVSQGMTVFGILALEPLIHTCKNEVDLAILHDDVIQRSYSPVLMWITNELRDELTTCQYNPSGVIIGADYQLNNSVN